MSKVCVLANFFPSRSQTFVINHVRGLRKRRYDVAVICKGPERGMSEEEAQAATPYGVRVVACPDFPQNPFRYVSAFLKSFCRFRSFRKRVQHGSSGRWRHLLSYAPYVDLLEREKPAVVHIHFGIIAQSLPEEVLPENSCVSWHGYDVNTLPAVHGAYLYADLFANPRVQHTVGSSFVARNLTELGAATDRLWRIPMGIDLSHFPFVDRSKRSTETWEILSVGRLHEVKGYDVLLRAFSKVHESFPEARLTIIGDGPQRNTLENRVRGLALESVVELRGSASAEEVASAMSRADIFAQTGVLAGDGAVESQGLVFIEAQATGLPIVCSDIGGVPESVARNESALLCRPNEVAEVSEALIRLGVDRDKRLAMGKAGRAFVEKTFSLEQMLDAFERLYQK